MNESVTVAQISDLHIVSRTRGARRSDRSAKRLARCVTKLNELRPDLVIATGDLTHMGREDEYVRLREVLSALKAPIYVLPGNHDNRDTLRRVFADHRYLFETEAYIAYALDAGPVRIVALDSTEPGRTGGYLDSQRLAWLQSRLEETPRVTALALHHPPFKTGVWPLDDYGFVNLDALGDVIRRNPHVKRIFSGHVHSVRSARLAGTLAITSPSMMSHLLLRTPPWAHLSLTFERAGFLLHSFRGNSSVSTTVVRINGSIEQLRI